MLFLSAGVPEWSNGTASRAVSLVLTKVRILSSALIIMELEIGNEKKLFDFIENIKNEKVALISHIDLDGMTAAKVINCVVGAEEIKFVEYEELNKNLVEELRNKGFKKIIFTDLYIKDDGFMNALEKFADILILDHHLAPDWNSNKTVFIKGEEGFSAGYLCYSLLSKIKNLEELDWLVACSCISDFCHIKPKDWLEKIFRKYGDRLEYEGTYVRKSGKFWDLQYNISMALIYFKQNKEMKRAYDALGKDFGDIGILNKYSKEVKEEIDLVVNEFKNKKEEIKEGYFFEANPKFAINSIVSSILSGTDIHKIFVIIQPEIDFFRVSVRRQDKEFDCNSFLQTLLKDLPDADGGGHVAAAGGHFMKKDLPEFRKRLELK